MGNWHCIPSSCATVHYREYQGAKIRWRYGNEPWQEISGDDYSTIADLGKCPVRYHAFGTFYSKNFSDGGCNVIGYWRTATAIIGTSVISYQPEYIGDRWVIRLINNRVAQLNRITKADFDAKIMIDLPSYGLFYRGTNQSCFNTTSAAYGDQVIKTHILRQDGGADNCGNCVFTITKNGQVVYTETRAVCPEVQKIPCQLSAVNKQIEIEKLPYLERVEIRDQSINTVFVSPLEAPLLDTKPLPSNCYNVYKTYILAPSLLSNFVPLPGVVNPYQFIAQICSSVGCPPPEYQVICDCNNCQSCPDGTCPIECDGQICCYNDYGVSVAQIPLVNYCGGNS